MKLEGARVAITGGAGFIGSHLVERLLGLGCRIRVIDDLSSGHLRNLPSLKDTRALSFIEGSVLDEKALRATFKGCDVVFHLATRNVRMSLRTPTVVHDVNSTGTLNALKAATAAHCRRFLYCSSSEVNGTADIVPMPELYHYRPETVYGASKLVGEYYAQVFHRSGWLETVIARPHNNYGPREHYAGHQGEVIPRFILWALAGRDLMIFGNGKQTRDFTYVTETADILTRLAADDRACGQVFNVCKGEEVSIAEIARLIVSLTGSQSSVKHLDGRPSDVLRLFGDPSRLRELLGMSPSIPIREGLARTIDWFREHVPVNKKTLASMDPANWRAGKAESWLPRE